MAHPALKTAMNLISFFATLALAVTLIEGFLILSRDYRSSSNRLFFLICMSIAVWLTGAVFGYSAPTEEMGFFWLRVASPGFIFMHAFVLHFTLRFTNVTKSRWIYLLYLPSFYFLSISLFQNIVFSEVRRSGDYWVLEANLTSQTFLLLMANYLFYYAVSLVLLFNHMRKTDSNRIRKQSKIIFAAIVITIASYNIEPFLAPLIFNYETYGLAPVFSIFWVTLIWFAMSRYHFLGVYERLLPGDIMEALNEMVIIMDSNHRVIHVNQSLKSRLKFPEEIHAFKDIFIEHRFISRLIDSLCNAPSAEVTLNLAVPEGDTGLVKVHIIPFRDHFGDRVGHIITARELPQGYFYLTEKGITRREYQLIQLILAGSSNRQISESLDISLRTVETHITNIFNKLGISRRSELVNYCSELFSLPETN